MNHFGIFLFGGGGAAAPTRHISTGIFSLGRKEKGKGRNGEGKFQALSRRTPTALVFMSPISRSRFLSGGIE